jgi:effector-binding domain-containing protein
LEGYVESHNQRRQKEPLVIDQPKIVQTKAQHTAVIRLTIPRAEMQHAMGPAMAEVMTAIAEQDIEATGPVFAHHLRVDADVFDFEVGVPVAAPIAQAGRVIPSQLPAETVAQTVYHGAYEGLPSAWGEFMEWITAEGHEPKPNLWECYVVTSDTSPDSTTWRTELNRPIRS